MERTYESAAALVGRAVGPLAKHLGPFVTSLIDQQYTANVIYIKLRHALASIVGSLSAVWSWLVSAKYTSGVTSTAVGIDTNAFAPRPDVVSGAR